MLQHLKQRVTDTLRHSGRALLATNGPAGLQASRVRCEADGLRLFMLVPRNSDHLFNLEHGSDVVATNDLWELRGAARLLPAAERPPTLGLLGLPEAEWCQVLEVRISQLQIRQPNGWGNLETIDVDENEP